jgi:hypothetical protein
VRDTPILLALVSLAFLANLTAFPLTNGLDAVCARRLSTLDQTWLGYLVASFAAARLIGSLVLSHAARRTRLAAPDDRRARSGTRCCWFFAQMPGPLSAVPSPVACGRCAELLHGRSLQIIAVARGGREIPRPRDGRAHDGDLQPAARAAGRRSADRVGRLARDRHRSMPSSASSSRRSSRCAGAPSCGAPEPHQAARRRIFFSSAGIGNSSIRAPDIPVISRVARWKVR